MSPWPEVSGRALRRVLAGRSRRGGQPQVCALVQPGGVRLLAARDGELHLWAEEPLRVGAVRSGLAVDPGEVARGLRTLLVRTGVPPSAWRVAIQSPRAVVRILELPRLPVRQLSAAVQRELGREYPLPLEETYLYWASLGSPRGQTVFTLGVPRDSIDSHLEALDLAGVEVILLDLLPLALARAGPPGQAVHVNIEAESLTLVLVDRSLPRVVRVLPLEAPLGVEGRARAVLEELLRTVRFYNQGPQGPLPVHSTRVALSGALPARPQLDSLRAEIERSVSFAAAPYQALTEVPPGFPAPLYAAHLGLLTKRAA